jgi:hypothetical protein
MSAIETSSVAPVAPVAPVAAAPVPTVKPVKTYSGQSKKQAKQAKKQAKLGNAITVGMTGIQKLAKSLAITLRDAASDNVKVDNATVRKAYWNRVRSFGDAIKQVSTPEMRTALVSLTNVELTNAGKLAFKNQDYRHLACAYDLLHSPAYKHVAWESYGENKMEATALKWFKGSYSDFIKNGLSCFEPSDKDVKLPNGETANANALVDDIAENMEEHATEKQRVKTKLTVTERVEKKAKSMADVFIKEYAKQKDSAFGTLLYSFFTAIRSNNDDGKINTLAILESMARDAEDCRNGTSSYSTV